jgi:hypothetical protein
MPHLGAFYPLFLPSKKKNQISPSFHQQGKPFPLHPVSLPLQICQREKQKASSRVGMKM